jgi:hypothetical protein
MNEHLLVKTMRHRARGVLLRRGFTDSTFTVKSDFPCHGISSFGTGFAPYPSCRVSGLLLLTCVDGGTPESGR